MAMATTRLSFFRSIATICAIVVVTASATQRALAQDVRTREEAAKILEIENATVTDSAVSGDVVNRSRNTVRDVELLIRHIWLWDRETKPGTNDPSTSAYYKLEKDIPSGSRVPFSYQPAIPLPKWPAAILSAPLPSVVSRNSFSSRDRTRRFRGCVIRPPHDYNKQCQLRASKKTLVTLS
jgi:hypothetical protein